MYRFGGQRNDNEADSQWDDFDFSADTCIEWRIRHVRWLTKKKKQTTKNINLNQRIFSRKINN